ncbi:DNA/RNA helicase domain-containing protein [Marinomonas gallaica]|uniref:DNA/RNA helicase domain-containing protein n=1 Tax=Marinomonas gallaica TaxID=1806667 RepID=UPI00083329C3|nr:DNA/RNA helicase domain-containing protein [Marinomonas gallaica]
MIVYSGTKREFLADVRSNVIADKVETEVFRRLNRNSPRNEKISWENSLQYMSQVLWDEDIPASAGVAIEYNLPMTNRRVDFILTGKDKDRRDTAVLIELKQWQNVEKTNKDAIVKTRFQHGMKETNHPSYQAWSYGALIQDYNETVRKESILLQPCAYLHNMDFGHVINDPFYEAHTNKAPVFIKQDAIRLASFLKKYVRYGDSDNILYRIEHGVIKPSKNLADALASMLKGNPEFLMIDDQKLVYETALDLAHKAKSGKKQTLIVNGGPGTGKSVVAINLLVEMTNREMLVQYVSKNAAPREVFKKKLTGTKKKTHIDQMFKGSGSYIEVEKDQFDALIVDEAHRLNLKSGLYGNLGENQIKEIISGSRLSIFFIDEYQRVTLQDIGTNDSIRSWADMLSSNVTELNLSSQFRCNGSDGYLSWVDNVLQVRQTANTTLDDIDYEVRVFDDPTAMRTAILEKNRLSNKARMVAGYCWDWKSKKDKSAMDIVIPEFNFEAQWNLTDDGSLWLIAEKSVDQVGCIHTCQGLELDYVGVILGDDFVIRDGFVVTDARNRSSNDRSIRGFKTMLKKDKELAKSLTDEIIKNTYRTLMTRGQKGCFIYSTDKETLDYFKASAICSTEREINNMASPFDGLALNIVAFDEANPYVTHVPVFDIQAAAGGFSDAQIADSSDWVELPDYIRASEGMFIVQVIGESMNRRIPSGSWCLFKSNPGGSRNGKVVLVQHRSIEDPDHGGSFTIKVYQSLKSFDNDEQVNIKVILKPDTLSFGYSNIELADDSEELMVIGEFLSIVS